MSYVKGIKLENINRIGDDTDPTEQEPPPKDD